MKIIKTPIEGIRLLQPVVYNDERGSFHETYRYYAIQDLTEDDEIQFVQENQSISHKNVFRGFHFQFGEYAQAKLVRVVKGAVVDMVIDLRRNSPTYGQMHSQLLSSENNLQMYIPVGFAHGFVSLEDETIFQYKCTKYYSKKHEGGIHPNSFLKEEYNINDRDKSFPYFEDYLKFYGKKINF